MLILNVVRETLIDDLNYSYAGNQLKAISDAAGERSLYDQKEYFDYSNAENTMNYDANGNLLADFDRKICTIQYNLLNLPAIIQFCNGNSIVNTYNAEGVKLSSTYYTLPEAVAVPVGEIVEPDTLPQAPQTMIVQYLGHIERTIIGDSVSYTLHHPEGYITLDALHRVDSWNYFRRDHLGNNVAVWNASADTTVQRMFYYPSGLPIGISTGQSAQPYKYNGKEYVEMHGYDVYEYGFRGYYATIARFTSIDPLCERTPWQSPYCYASNNFTGEIDWMGLSSGEAYTTSDPVAIAAIMSYLGQGGSLNNYDFDENGVWIDITDEINNSISIFVQTQIYNFWATVTPGMTKSKLCYIWVTAPVSPTYSRSDEQISKLIDDIARKALANASCISGGEILMQRNPFFWMGKEGDVYYRSQRFGAQRYIYNRSYNLAGKRLDASLLGKIGKVAGVLSIGVSIYDVFENGLTVGNLLNTTASIAGLLGPWGMLLSTSYEIADLVTGYFTGISISDRLDNIKLIEKKW